MPSPSAHPTRPGRVLGVIRLAWAAFLLAVPAAVMDAMGGRADSKSVTVARVLGARHAVQGIVEVATWPRWRHAGSAVDTAHSLTVAGLGIADHRWRRIAVTDSIIAATFALAGQIA